jgi:hypothetical protein
VGTFASRAVELGALALQPPLELGAVHVLRVHINVYYVKRLMIEGGRIDALATYRY